MQTPLQRIYFYILGVQTTKVSSNAKIAITGISQYTNHQLESIQMKLSPTELLSHRVSYLS